LKNLSSLHQARATDKTVYVAGEDVHITVCLKNVGCLSQSLTTSFADLVFVWIKMDIWVETGSCDMKSAQTVARLSPLHIEETTFTIALDQSLTKTILWDQSWYGDWNRTGYPGKFYVSAVVPEPHVIYLPGFDKRIGGQMYAYSEMNIRAT
jgi:hypothetical protein